MLAVAAFFAIYINVVQVYDIMAEKIHFVEYGILAYLLYYALKLKIKGIKIYPVVLVLVFLIEAERFLDTISQSVHQSHWTTRQ